MGSPPFTQKRSIWDNWPKLVNQPIQPLKTRDTKSVFFYSEFTICFWQKGVEYAIKLIYFPVLVISQRSLLGHARLVIIMIKIRTWQGKSATNSRAVQHQEIEPKSWKIKWVKKSRYTCRWEYEIRLSNRWTVVSRWPESDFMYF